MPAGRYRGRFAPSPTGLLHAGSLAAALASWLDARAHGGRWLVRIEDVDAPRCLPGAAEAILEQLAAFGLAPDEPPVRQSERSALYDAALGRLLAQDRAYPCGCTRADIAQAVKDLQEEERLAFAALLVTDINTQNSLLLVKGDSAIIERISYPHVEQDEIFDMPGVVSRKKQLIPYLTSLIKELAVDGALPTTKSGGPFKKKK